MELLGYYTEKGRELSAKVLTGTALVITGVTAGSGETELTATALEQERQTLAVGAMKRSGTTVTLPVTLAEAQAEAGYTLREVGVYASDPQEGTILYRVYRLETELPVEAGGQMVVRMNLQETVSESGEVTVEAEATGLLLYGDLMALRGAPEGLAALGSGGTVPAEQIPALAAGKITSGTFNTARIPALAADKITSGTFDAARIPALAADKITSGTFAATDVKAKAGTDYTTYRVRNIAANTTAMTAGTTSLSNGNLYFQYE